MLRTQSKCYGHSFGKSYYGKSSFVMGKKVSKLSRLRHGPGFKIHEYFFQKYHGEHQNVTKSKNNEPSTANNVNLNTRPSNWCPISIVSPNIIFWIFFN